MAGSVNKAILVGHLGRDPEIRTTQSGGRVASLSVATGERWRDRATGEQHERTEWHRVVVFDEKLVEICEKYLRKGGKVYLEGQIATRKWTDQAGAERYVTEIVLRQWRSSIVLLGDRRDGDPPPATGTATQAQPAQAGGDLDDEIPF